jgi:hypothetical protein
MLCAHCAAAAAAAGCVQVANEAAAITGLPEGLAASLPMPVTTYIKVGARVLAGTDGTLPLLACTCRCS